VLQPNSPPRAPFGLKRDSKREFGKFHDKLYNLYPSKTVLGQLRNANQQTRTFQINVLIQLFVSSTCFEHPVFVIRKTICTGKFLSSTSLYLLAINQLNAKKILFYNKFIIYLYMFQALLCLSSGGQNCIIQHLVSSHL